MSNAPTHSVHSAIVTGPLLLLLLFLIGCLVPGTAHAVDGSDALNFRTISEMCGPLGIGKFEAQDTSVSYCMNQDCPGPSEPGGPWRAYDQGWTWLDDEFAAVVCHGYPSATSFGGHSLTPDRARAATQLAVWMLKGTTRPDGTFSYTNNAGIPRSGRFSQDAEIVAAARWLYEKFGEGEYRDIPGLCKVASRTEIAEKNYSLTPGAYVGVAAVEDDGVDFALRMAEIHQELLALQAESNELMQTISKNLEEMGL